MFNKKSNEERIGELQKSQSLQHLVQAEQYLHRTMRNHSIKLSYDVIANEIPYFDTLNYTEFAHCLILHPLQQELRIKQMVDAYNDNSDVVVDYVEYFKNKVLEGTSNKYSHIQSEIDANKEYRKTLVVLVGSNKLKERICLNKLKWIKENYGNTVFFKPHPITKHQLVGELKDLFGKENVLDRDTDLYSYLVKADIIFTSHMSESATYAVCLDKIIEPIDVYNKVEQGSFYHINKFLFMEPDPKLWINKTFNSYKSGIINPEIDPNWKEKIDNYLQYISIERNKYKNKYIVSTKKKD